jgi:hypothetical protein
MDDGDSDNETEDEENEGIAKIEEKDKDLILNQTTLWNEDEKKMKEILMN